MVRIDRILRILRINNPGIRKSHKKSQSILVINQVNPYIILIIMVKKKPSRPEG